MINNLSAQMPDWLPINDKDGNKYYIDKNGKIWTSGKPEFKYKAVSLDGLEFYLNQGIELIKSHYKIEGLLLLKSIMVMPIINDRIYDAQSKASNIINNLIKNDGPRFVEYNKKASILLYKVHNKASIINDYMPYSLEGPACFKIIRTKIKEKYNYSYNSVLMGFVFSQDFISQKENFSEYDILLAIDCEKFSYPVRSAKKIENSWRKTLGSDTFQREKFILEGEKIIYIFKDKFPPYYSGYEGFFSKKNNGYHIRVITSSGNFVKYKSAIEGIVRSFKV